jgi:hypothetical protein
MKALHLSLSAGGLSMRFIVALISLLLFQPAFASEFDYLPDHPGTVKVDVSRANTSMYGLSTADAAAFNANLERLRDLLIAQPDFDPPKGITIFGYMRANDYVPKVKGVPVPAFGHLLSQPCYRDKKTGQPVWLKFTTDEIVVRVNNPYEVLDPLGEEGANVKICYEPIRAGEINGFPIYRVGNGDEVIMLTRSDKPLWVPYTREEFVNRMTRFWQEQASKVPEDIVSPAIVKGHKDFLARMSPEDRKAQARSYPGSQGIYEPGLAPVGSDLGQPLVKINPQWFDPSLPRSAFQLITILFHYSGNLDPDKPAPDEYGLVSALRLWQYLRTADWKAISGALTTK